MSCNSKVIRTFFIGLLLILSAGCYHADLLTDKSEAVKADSAQKSSKEREAGALPFDAMKSGQIQAGDLYAGEVKVVDAEYVDTRSGIPNVERPYRTKDELEEPPVVDSPLFERIPIPDLRLEVNITTRKLYVYSKDYMVAVHPVAVGRSDWPTRTGRWNIYAVVWNPWWHPPDEEWAWGRAIMAPGDPDNPLGRAQLVYDSPRSIHGTNNPASIGRAASHGSIRVTNEVAMELARQVMEAVGNFRDEEWFENVRRDPSRHVMINLPEPVPIRVYR